MRTVDAVVLGLAVVLAVVAPAAPARAQAEIPLAIEKNRFQPEDIKVKANTPFVLVITNKDAGPEEFESHDLRLEKVIPGGRTMRVRVPALKPGRYSFFGEYHEKTARGRIVAE